MTTHRLDTRYRRLLRAYPRGQRREEILDTLIEAAPPDRTRPTVTESVDLLRHGMRARLGRPASKGVVAVAVLVAMVSGFVGASLAARAAWEFVPGFPQGAALSEISGTVFTVGVDEYHERAPFVANGVATSWGDFFAYGYFDEYGYATQELAPGPVLGDYQAFIRDARARLQADGWRIREEYPTGNTQADTGELMVDGRDLWATRDGLSLLVSATTNQVPQVPGGYSSTAQIIRLQPPWVSLVAVAAGLMGALLGWLLTGWVSRRTEHRGSVVRTPAVIALVCILPGTVYGILMFVADAFVLVPPVTPFWWPLVTYGFQLTRVALVLTVAIVLIAALPGRRRADVEMAGPQR